VKFIFFERRRFFQEVRDSRHGICRHRQRVRHAIGAQCGHHGNGGGHTQNGHRPQRVSGTVENDKHDEPGTFDKNEK